ncbi:MAG: GyrI-like domain-containing protein [Anaerolineaceae bacterium]|nr:GyrI-like domain-containing protein [Anaerolineaceae bacterium]MDD4043472.1 GyrI-like domain-containing protein [Anaerolineaceae bacterium]
MNVRIESKPAFQVAGLAVKNGQNENLPAVRDRLFTEFSMPQLLGLGNGMSFGSCFDYTQEPMSFSYIAGFDLADPARAAELGLQVLNVPAAEYAIIEVQGPVPACIMQGWDYAMGTWLPENGYRHAGTPDFEHYLEGDLNSPDYRMELWVPIVKI